MYDTVSQYEQVLSGHVTDWHPPAMVRLWQLLHPLGPTTSPMFVVQVALYSIGFALIVAALVRNGRSFSAAAAVLLAMSPLLLGWQMVILKDAQMLGALTAAVGIVANYRMGGRPVPALAAILVVLVLVYATLVRANGLFATIPLAVLLLRSQISMIARGAIALGAMLALLAVSPLIDHRLLHAEPSGIEKSLALFDLAAIAVRAQGPAPFTPSERADIVRRHCVKAFFWDPLGDPSACAPAAARLIQLADPVLFTDLAEAVAAHPVAYAQHRLRHWNSTERWLVAPGLPEAGPPDEDEVNDLGLRTPAGPIMPAWQSAGAFEAGTPLGWPILWVVVALLLLPVAWRTRAEPTGGLALALLASALTLELSFLVISVASDLRYHLWPMTASGLALILLGNELRMSRRERAFGAALLATVIAGGLVTRSTLPEAPSDYEAMLHAPSG